MARTGGLYHVIGTVFYFFQVTPELSENQCGNACGHHYAQAVWGRPMPSYSKGTAAKAGAFPLTLPWNAPRLRELTLPPVRHNPGIRKTITYCATTLSMDRLHYPEKSLRPAINFPSILHTEGRLPPCFSRKATQISLTLLQEKDRDFCTWNGITYWTFCWTFNEL